MLGDSGYQGLKKLHTKSETPLKRTKKHPLTKEDRAYNHVLGSVRIEIEHVNSWLKRFNIVAFTYRGMKKNFFKFQLLIASIFNMTGSFCS